MKTPNRLPSILEPHSPHYPENKLCPEHFADKEKDVVVVDGDIIDTDYDEKPFDNSEPYPWSDKALEMRVDEFLRTKVFPGKTTVELANRLAEMIKDRTEDAIFRATHPSPQSFKIHLQMKEDGWQAVLFSDDRQYDDVGSFSSVAATMNFVCRSICGRINPPSIGETKHGESLLCWENNFKLLMKEFRKARS